MCPSAHELSDLGEDEGWLIEKRDLGVETVLFVAAEGIEFLDVSQHQ